MKRFTAWPLWATLAGVAGVVGTIATDLRPAAEAEAWRNGEDYTVTSSDMIDLEPLMGRIGHVVGLVAIVALLILVAVWRRHVEDRFVGSVAARVFSAGLIATAAGLTLGYGWRGALANYLGPEAGMYDAEGLFVYFILTDFGAYLPWFATIVSLGALTWMAWAERLVSRGLGAFVGFIAIGLFVATVVTGVPGLPGTLGQVGLTVAGIWLAFGRSAIILTGPLTASSAGRAVTQEVTR